MSDSLFGSSTIQGRTSDASVDPILSALYGLKFNLANQVASGGIPQAMSGYLKNVLIPFTENTAVKAGLGRSGAMAEAVSNATLSQGTGFLESLLTGIPNPFQFGARTEKTTQKPGALDFLNLIGGGAGLLGTFLPGGALGDVGKLIGSGLGGAGSLFSDLFSSSSSATGSDLAASRGVFDLSGLFDTAGTEAALNAIPSVGFDFGNLAGIFG